MDGVAGLLGDPGDFVIDLVLLGATYGAIGLTLAYTLRTGISPVPTTQRVRRTLMEGLPRELGPGTIFELGCGWGSLAVPLARAYPAHRVVGYELSPVPWAVSRLRSCFVPGRNLRVLRRDFHRAHLGDASLVVCYLYPGGMERLRSKFEAELRADAWVVSNFFPVPGWTPHRTLRADDLDQSPVYYYRPAQAGSRDGRQGRKRSHPFVPETPERRST